MPNSCFFTGHRQIPATDVRPLQKALLRTVEELYMTGCRLYYAGGAWGFDTLSAEAVLALKEKHADAELILLLPCRDQTNGWPEMEAERYYTVLRSSDRFCYLNETYTDKAMEERNAALAAHGEVCVAYVTQPSSGTGQTVRIAESMGKTVINLADKISAGI